MAYTGKVQRIEPPSTERRHPPTSKGELSIRQDELDVARDLNDLINSAVNCGDYDRSRKYADAAHNLLSKYQYIPNKQEGQQPRYSTLDAAGMLQEVAELLEAVTRFPRLQDTLTAALDTATQRLADMFNTAYRESMPTVDSVPQEPAGDHSRDFHTIMEVDDEPDDSMDPVTTGGVPN